jgi:urease accessory protein
MALLQATVAQENAGVFAGNRAFGKLDMTVQSMGGRTRRQRVREEGCLRARFPHPQSASLEAILVNTAGGIAGGDRHDINVVLGAGAHLTIGTAAAEKVYRSLAPDSRISVNFQIGAAASLAWLPQETIVFDGAILSRDIAVDLAESATLVLAEAIVFGRAAMGERVQSGRLFDRWRVRRGGRLIFAETLTLTGGIASAMAQPAIAAGGSAVATVLIVPADEAVVERVRALEPFAGEVGISAWNGFALARFCAPDGEALRRDLIAVLGAIRHTALPRLWLN